MTTKLAPVRPPMGDERQYASLDADTIDQDEEAIRVIAAVWEWAAGRDPDAAKAARS